jgi:hypothetical protein
MARKSTRDLAEMMEQSNIGFDPAMYILTHIANEDVPEDMRMKYSMELMPYLYAKKKDVTVEGAMQGNLTISWLNAVPHLAIEDATGDED